MKDENADKRGYKRTKLGWIPREWQAENITKVANISRGRFSARPRNDPSYFGGSTPFVQTGDVSGAHVVVRSFSQTLNERGVKCSRVFPAGTILMTIAANIGDAAILGFDSACPDSLVGIQCHPEKVSAYFVCAYLNTIKSYQRYLSPRSSQHNTNLETISECIMPVPPIAEQKSIAAILSTCDAAIDQQSDLISAKKVQKKALMQQLLTGKKRLPRFRGDWRTCRLGELFTERNEVDADHLPLLAITGSRGVIHSSEVNRKDSSSEDKSRYKVIRPGDIGYNTMRMWQGVSAVSQLEGIISPAYTVCIPGPDVDANFIGHFFKFQPTVHLFWRYSQGLVDDTLSLKYPSFASIFVTVPSLGEQRAIADVLACADAEISLLERRCEALEQLKKGLMQKLLTGQIRVKP